MEENTTDEARPDQSDEAGSGDDETPSGPERRARRVKREAEADARRLQGGQSFHFLGADLPVRTAAAFGIFLAAFMVVWLLLWVLVGGIGLGLGWIVAALAGFAAVRAYANRFPQPRREPRSEAREQPAGDG